MDSVKLAAVIMASICLSIIIIYTLIVFFYSQKRVVKKITQGNFKVLAVEKSENIMDFSLSPYSTQKSLWFINRSETSCNIEVEQQEFNFNNDICLNYSSWGENWEQTNPVLYCYNLPLAHNQKTKKLLINIAFLEMPTNCELKSVFQSFPKIKLS